MNSDLNLLYRCNHHQKPFMCSQRFSSNQLWWVISRSLKICHLSDTDLSAVSLSGYSAVPYIQFQDGLLSASFVQQSQWLCGLKETRRLFQILYRLSHLELLTHSKILPIHTRSCTIFTSRAHEYDFNANLQHLKMLSSLCHNAIHKIYEWFLMCKL